MSLEYGILIIVASFVLLRGEARLKRKRTTLILLEKGAWHYASPRL